MAKNNTEYQQEQWILEYYKSIIENPESYGYSNIVEHMDKVIADIKEDLKLAIHCSAERNVIKTTTEKWQQKLNT